MKDILRNIVDVIEKHQFFLVTSHVRLDGDALGSELAMYHFLLHMGKDVVVYNEDETPGNYRFLPGSDKIVNNINNFDRFEVAIVLDCSELERVGKEFSRIIAIKNIINIDHHFSNGKFGGFPYIDYEASSTGELIYRLLNAVDFDLTTDIATNLFTAIFTDTGGFRYSVKKDTLVASGHLVEKGADPQWISESIFESYPPSKIRLMSRVLDTLTFDWSKKVGYMIVLRNALEETGATMEHTDGFVDIPRSIQGVEVSILFVELSDSCFKLSLRSKGRINVERVAKAFGGGGHINAAACRIDGDLETVKRKVMDVMETGAET